ncbi:MAG: hypothetical protein KDD92_13600 [Caldilineaceae bacterium]|nr:hypothetical protein [Caldilineaceae bacterium]
MGVIDSLSAGYRILGRRVGLLLIPILIDLAIWQLPRLSMGVLFGRIADLYMSASTLEGMPADFAEMAGQLGPFVAEYGNSTNLLRMTANQTLVHVPSLMRVMGPLPGATIVQFNSWGALFFSFLGLGALALLLGVIYLRQLAQYVPIGEGVKQASIGAFAGSVISAWLKILAFVVLLGAGIGSLYVIANFAAIPILLFAPALITLIAFGLFVFVFLLFLFFYFVTAAIVLDDLSLRDGIAHSVRVVRHNFGATVFFVLISNLITVGFSLILAPIGQRGPAGTAVAIFINAYIGTGLAMALLIFYRTRWLKLVGAPPDLYEQMQEG